VVDPTAAFKQLAASAINMQGTSYYVNYRKIVQSVAEISQICLEDRSCLSFDYSDTSQTGWLHRYHYPLTLPLSPP